MKGIVLAGGSGTRLFPVTQAVSKQLLPLYDKPMIYYPLSVLMLAGIRDIAVIVTERDRPLFQNLLGNGSQWGITLTYITQRQPEGIAQAFLLAEDFLAGSPACLILGDNLFYGHGMPAHLSHAKQSVMTKGGACIFAYQVADPQRYGVLGFDAQGRVHSIEEKPQHPPSKYAVTGLYFYDAQVCEYAKQLRPSARGELEITDLNRLYLAAHKLHVERLGRGYTWLDTGTHDALMDASTFVAITEKRQGNKIGCLDEIAYAQGWIDMDQLQSNAQALGQSTYGEYLQVLADEVVCCESV